MRERNVIKTIDLFCGCGGLSKGFENAGYSILAAYEFWDDAISCYNDNFDNHKAYKLNLSDTDAALKIIKKHKAQIIIGGPPCQDFSLAGNREEGERADLTVSFAKIVCTMQPEFFVMENVETAKLSDAYKTARQLLKNANYGLTEKVLNSAYHGVPQKRKRFFCVGHLNDQDGFLDSLLSAGQNALPMTIRDYSPDFPIQYYYRHPRSYKRRAIFSIDEPAPTMRTVNRPKPPTYVRHNNDATENIANVRSLNYRERALIQSFPENYIWNGSPASLDKMIGNAVPVKLAEYVANCVKDYSKGKTTHYSAFIDWLKDFKGLKPNAAHDVLSRLNRAKKVLHFKNHSMDNYISQLVEMPDYIEWNKSAKSQVKRAVNLYFEYMKYKEPSV